MRNRLHGLAPLLAMAMLGLSSNSFGAMELPNAISSRMASGRAFGYMPTSKNAKKSNRLRYKHNAKLKRRKGA
jgi:hypothetical protein